MTPKEETMTWDEPTDKLLLLAILKHYSNVPHDWEALAKLMGPKCTPRAVHERIKTLQKKAKATFDKTSPTFPGENAATPRKRPRAASGTPARQTPARQTPARQTKKAMSDTKPQEEEKQEQPEDNSVTKDEPLFEGFD